MLYALIAVSVIAAVAFLRQVIVMSEARDAQQRVEMVERYAMSICKDTILYNFVSPSRESKLRLSIEVKPEGHTELSVSPASVHGGATIEFLGELYEADAEARVKLPAAPFRHGDVLDGAVALVDGAVVRCNGAWNMTRQEDRHEKYGLLGGLIALAITPCTRVRKALLPPELH